ncbi:AraC family transcriptional regulator [Paenibacillus yonginensis]|uniref:AraC family transcriptional regulator n=1 Tax=Paenibacillus yonginensis TaxID=1462996 RepID=A0A1B1MZW5_9BACL|nr:AraC family transcriptional regulator [Paenibacillus yonginensis]ANS74709.1 AraC family transcriptional regulator [Paenibacillus yonginensis]
MNINNLFFHIHYCNSKQSQDGQSMPIKLSRTLHHHELVLLSEAQGIFNIDKKEYKLQDGMLLYIAPNIAYTLEIDSDHPVRLMTVHFSYTRVNLGEEGWGLAEERQALPLQPARQPKDFYLLEDAFRKLCESWYGKLPGYEFTSRTLLQQLFITIYQGLKQDRQNLLNYSSSLKVEKIITYMHEHLSGKIMLAELSELVQLSPAYLSRTFKELTGYSVIEFFNKLKMDKAKEMLIEGNPKIKEVAGALGFQDEFYFSRLFKKSEGLSPSEFYSKNVHGV